MTVKFRPKRGSTTNRLSRSHCWSVFSISCEHVCIKMFECFVEKCNIIGKVVVNTKQTYLAIKVRVTMMNLSVY